MIDGQRVFCHCGDLAPGVPAHQRVPESNDSSLTFIDHLHSADMKASATTKVVLPSTPAPRLALSSEELTRHHKQLVFCVWLT